MDGSGARRSRSSDETTRLPRIPDHDQVGEYERAAAHAPHPEAAALAAQQAASAPRLDGQGYTQPGWYDRLQRDVARDNGRALSQATGPRHQAAKDDLPGPSRRELARLVRQVRALVIVNLFGGLAVSVLIGWLTFR